MLDNKALEIVIRARDEASKTIKSVGNAVEKETTRMNKMAKGFGVAGAAITAASAVGAKGIFDLAKSGALLKDVETSFGNMAHTAGTSSEMLLKDLDKAAAGTVANSKLMKDAVTAEMLGIPIEEFSGLIKVARQQSVAMGEDMGFMLESVVKGVGRASPLILDNLGITLKLGEVYEQAAASLGKKADQLTAAEQKQALLNAVLEFGAEKEAAMGGEVNSNAENYARMQASVQNMVDTFSVHLVPIVADVADWMAKMAEKLEHLDPKWVRIGAVVAVVTVALGLLIGPVLMLMGLVPILGAVIGALSIPIVLVIGLIGLLVAAGVWLYMHWDEVKAKAIAFGQNVKNTFIDLKNGAVESIQNMWQGIKDSFWNGIEQAKQMVRDFGTSLISIIKNIKLPSIHVDIEEKKVGKFNLKIPKLKFYQFGGLVGNNGMAYLHKGEFVMSRGMLEGRRLTPPQMNNTTNNQPITINVNGNANAGVLGNTLAWQLRNMRS